MGLITIPHTFKNDTQGKTTDLDACFSSIVTLVNGNLNEQNVKKSANTLMVGGFSVSATPGANKITNLAASGKQQFGLVEHGQVFCSGTYQYPPTQPWNKVDSGRTFNGRVLLNFAPKTAFSIMSSGITLRMIGDGNDGAIVPAGSTYAKVITYAYGNKTLGGTGNPTTSDYMHFSIELTSTHAEMGSNIELNATTSFPFAISVIVNTGWFPVVAGDVVAIYGASSWGGGGNGLGDGQLSAVWYFL